MRSIRYLFFIMLSVLLLLPAAAQAKSLYVIDNINASPTPISAYDIQGTSLVYQTTHNVPSYAGGAVGLGIDTDSEFLFVTYEFTNKIELINAKTMQSEGTATAPNASDLAGIVVDQGKSKVYTMDRDTNHLYVYTWDAANKTLTLDGGAYVSLANVSKAHGIALDETNGRLYVGDRTKTVRYFDTTNWAEQGSFQVSQDVMGIAVDVTRGLVYTGNAYAGYGSQGLLCKYDLNSGTETTHSMGQSNNAVGVAVDPATGYLYVTTGDQASGGTDELLVFDLTLTQTYTTGDIGNPTGVVVPGKGGTSYNPLNLSKDGTVQ